jgi:DNA invertase Pin-like site-specific DNA recombinase/DNA-binding winged helix-turn-helix (wHTH) protein
MSTLDQQESIANQKDAIKRYATKNGYEVIETYADEGKSGLAIKRRDGLRRLLSDVVNGHAQFKTILVYDVSRWGRFQDLDEAAHYEFLCKAAGIPIRYCAEEFKNDGSMPSLIMKALKRMMAAEFSRELSVKVSAGQVRLAKMGFRVSGTAGLGLRRMMVCPGRSTKVILHDGEQKALKGYHTILVPGPRKEIKAVRDVFELASHRKNTPRKIAQYLNQKEMWPWSADDDRRWTEETVLAIIKNEKYKGWGVFGKTESKLGARERKLPREEWVVSPNAFAPIVEPALFEKVQRVIRNRTRRIKSDDYYLRDLRRVLEKYGKITERLSMGRGGGSHRTYCKRFGSMVQAYDLVGYKPPSKTLSSIANYKKTKKLRIDLFRQLKELYPENLRSLPLPGQTQRQIIEFDWHVRVSVHVCRQCRSTTDGQPRWILTAQPLEEGYPCLICLPNSSLTKILSFYLIPQFGGMLKRYKILKENHKWLEAGRKLQDLSQLRVAATTMAGEWQEKDDTTVVGDVLMSSRTPIFTIGRREITLPPINAELFKLLLLNAGNVVPRRQLTHPFTRAEFPQPQLNERIARLRKTLGFPLRERIQTVKNKGYKYEIPGAKTV